MQPIPLNDYTDLQRLRRRLYRIHDVRLPVPIAAIQAGVGLATLLATIAVLGLLGLRLDTPTMAVPYLGPMVAAAKLVGGDMIGGRSPARWVLGWAGFALRPRLMVFV